MPQAVQILTLLNPLRYFLVVLRKRVPRGRRLRPAIDQFWPMAVIGAATLTLAGWLFRHRMY